MFPSVEFSPLIYPLIHRFEFVANAADLFLDTQGFEERESLASTVRDLQCWQATHADQLSQTEQLCVVDCRNILTAFYGLNFFLEHPSKDKEPETTQQLYGEVVTDLRDLCRTMASQLRECYMLSIGESSMALV